MGLSPDLLGSGTRGTLCLLIRVLAQLDLPRHCPRAPGLLCPSWQDAERTGTLCPFGKASVKAIWGHQRSHHPPSGSGLHAPTRQMGVARGLRNSVQTSLHRTLLWVLTWCLGCVWRLRCTERLQRPALPRLVVAAGGSVGLKGTSETQFASQCAVLSPSVSQGSAPSVPPVRPWRPARGTHWFHLCGLVS